MITAEFRKARGSVLQYLPLLALPFVALTTFLALYTNPAAGGMTVLWWQALFITGSVSYTHLTLPTIYSV